MQLIKFKYETLMLGVVRLLWLPWPVRKSVGFSSRKVREEDVAEVSVQLGTVVIMVQHRREESSSVINFFLSDFGVVFAKRLVYFSPEPLLFVPGQQALYSF